MNIPKITRIHNLATPPEIKDIPSAVRRNWMESKTLKRVKPGQRIAIGCGSRGIAEIATIVKTTVEVFLEAGTKPFILAAMGSHGGATAEGQRELLASYGITPEKMGVPVVSDMNSEKIGLNSWGEPVWWDCNALRADGVITVSRIKPHTDYRGKYESGITKMMVIGLGKREGAAQHHRWGWKGLQQMLPETAKVLLDKTPFLGGLAILENAHDKTAHLQVVDRDELLDVEPGLLDRAKALMGRIPFAELDVLIIGEIGKNYSGAGIDPNVVGRLLIEAAPELETNRPRITRMVALEVAPESHGNATGIGIADLTTNRALASIDPIPFRMNNLTACFLWRSKLPLGFETDRECIQAAIETCWQPIEERRKLVIIPNSLELSDMWISDALHNEIKNDPDWELTSETISLPFMSNGNLDQKRLFPHSVQARRK